MQPRVQRAAAACRLLEQFVLRAPGSSNRKLFPLQVRDQRDKVLMW